MDMEMAKANMFRIILCATKLCRKAKNKFISKKKRTYIIKCVNKINPTH